MRSWPEPPRRSSTAGWTCRSCFGIGGERDLSERELPHLSGWRDSGPVRAGNGAWGQRQLDVYGSLLDAAYTLREQLGEMDDGTRMFLVAAVEAAASRWHEDDQGLWEIRGPARPFVHSKLMCWVALDRGLAMMDQLRCTDRAAAWSAVRDEIRDVILTHGWSERAGAFAQSLGSDELDASVLLIATVGFLPSDDDRVLSTIDAIDRGLRDESGLTYRYRSNDGFDSPEGSFLLCTFWLAEALAVTGQVERSREVLSRAAGCANELGLLSETDRRGKWRAPRQLPSGVQPPRPRQRRQALALAEQRAGETVAPDQGTQHRRDNPRVMTVALLALLVVLGVILGILVLG